MKKIKGFLCLLMASFIICNTSYYAYAQGVSASAKAYVINLNSLDSNSVKNYILSLGFTEEEYNAALEELSMEYGISYRASKGFPSNPTDGQEYVVTTKKIPVSSLEHLGIIAGTASLKDVASALGTLLAGGEVALSPVALIALAGALISIGAGLAGYQYVQFEIHYIYGITNDGVPGWNVGPVYTKLS